MMIDQAIAQVMNNEPDITQSVMSHQFNLFIDGQCYQNTKTYLYDNCIVLNITKQKTQTYLKINFNFDLIFQLLIKNQSSQSSTNGDPYGIKFQRFQKILLLKDSTHHSKQLYKWRDILATKLNQRGFHQLFKPIKKIGKGNFATVYLVLRHDNGKKYAVKAFSKQGTYSQQNGKESLINQIEVMRSFSHKNLMHLHGVYQSQNSIYVAVELLEGGQLYDKIKVKHKFTSSEIKLTMKGILEGLQVMHMHNIMHRDLKPQNILLRKEGDYDCVIADFGLAQNCTKNPYLFVRCGTPGYVAPQIVNLKDLKAKYGTICDLFSVGVIFHMLVLRKSPFPGKEYDEVLSQNRKCQINFSSPQYSHLSQTWLDLMKKLLEKDPSKRITATEALNHDFFSKDSMFSQWNKQRTSVMQRQSIRLQQQCQSPLMITKNADRKRGLLRDDSCLKFKMKQNILTGRTQDTQTVQQIDSPGLIKKPVATKNVQSRFKKRDN